MDALYPLAKGALLPWVHYGLHWTIEGIDRIPETGPIILASNHISYLDPLTLAYVADQKSRRLRFLAKQELFDKKPLGSMLRGIHQIPVQRGRADASQALGPAVDALGRGECVAVFPEGTISPDLEPMTFKSGTARLARQAGVAITPVGLWGTHRIMYKGRRPAPRWGVAQTAVVGEPVKVGADDHVKDATERLAVALGECVARARAIYPAHPGDTDEWWWRDPDTALHTPKARP